MSVGELGGETSVTGFRDGIELVEGGLGASVLVGRVTTAHV